MDIKNNAASLARKQGKPYIHTPVRAVYKGNAIIGEYLRERERERE